MVQNISKGQPSKRQGAGPLQSGDLPKLKSGLFLPKTSRKIAFQAKMQVHRAAPAKEYSPEKIFTFLGRKFLGQHVGRGAWGRGGLPPGFGGGNHPVYPP